MLSYLKYMYNQDLELNNLQWPIYHKMKPNQTKPNISKAQEIIMNLIF